MLHITPLEQLDAARFESPAILKKLASSSRRLAELKGFAGTIPNQGILINALVLREAKDSSEIENIVTTHDELFKEDLGEFSPNAAAKEVTSCGLNDSPIMPRIPEMPILSESGLRISSFQPTGPFYVKPSITNA